MDTFTLIKSRRSTRAFKHTPVEQKKLNLILEAGRYAPSGNNRQLTHFTMIKDRQVLLQLAAIVREELEFPENDNFYYHAPVLIVTANKVTNANHTADCACAVENMLLMANDLDLGSCYINRLSRLNENARILKFFKGLGMAEDERIYAAAAFGYPDTPDGLPDRSIPERTGNPVTIIDPEFMDYKRALSQRREPVENPRVVYQGEPGAFSEMAAIHFFGEGIELNGLYGFEDTFRALKDQTADYAVLPIENSTTGAIRQVYDLLIKYDCFIVGETSVEISQNLMALPGTTLEDITCVCSHEQGLFQCEQFLNEHREWKRIPQADTAGSAKLIAETKDPHMAAICSKRAAEIYGLQILAESINYNQLNTTRFVVISPKMELRENRDKICISLTAPHESGALYEVLSIFKANHLNLVKLESRPILGKNWEYMFFIEFTGTLMEEGKDYFLLELMHATKNLRVYGNFKSNI